MLSLMIQSILVLSLLRLAPVTTLDEEPQRWPQFLGLGGAAVATSSEPLPLSLDQESDLLWKTGLAAGSSSPCIDGNRLFLTTHEGDHRHMLAFDRQTGDELWRYSIRAPGVGTAAHIDADLAAPTPCSDGERVIFYFGDYGLLALDFDGNLLWENPMPVPEAPFGIGTSPILVDDLVILSRDGCPDSAIVAYDRETGAERWRIPRLGFTFSFGTPFVWDNVKRRELVLASTTQIVALNPEDGVEFWRVDGVADFVCTTPTADTNTLYFAAWSTGGAPPAERARVSWGEMEFTEAELADGTLAFQRLDRDSNGVVDLDEMPESRAKDAYAFFDQSQDGLLQPEEVVPMITMPQGRGRNVMVAIDAGGEGNVSETHVRWRHRRGIPYVASPLLYQGRVYLAKTGGFLTCLDAATGEPYFSQVRLEDPSEYYSTPVGVAGHVMVCGSGGKVFVLRATDEFELVHQADFGERITATPAIVDNTIYLRTEHSLWAFRSAP